MLFCFVFPQQDLPDSVTEKIRLEYKPTYVTNATEAKISIGEALGDMAMKCPVNNAAEVRQRSNEYKRLQQSVTYKEQKELHSD